MPRTRNRSIPTAVRRPGGTGLPRITKQTIASIVSVKTQRCADDRGKPKQQRIEAKADRADAEGIILDVYRPGAGSVLSDLVDIEIFCAQKEKCKNRQHGNGAEG